MSQQRRFTGRVNRQQVIKDSFLALAQEKKEPSLPYPFDAWLLIYAQKRNFRDLEFMEATVRVRSTRLLGVGVGSSGGRGLGDLSGWSLRSNDSYWWFLSSNNLCKLRIMQVYVFISSFLPLFPWTEWCSEMFDNHMM